MRFSFTLAETVALSPLPAHASFEAGTEAFDAGEHRHTHEHAETRPDRDTNADAHRNADRSHARRTDAGAGGHAEAT